MRSASTFAVALLTLGLVTASANGQNAKTGYVPLSGWTDASVEAFSQWEIVRKPFHLGWLGAN